MLHATDTPTSIKSGIENENVFLQHNDEIYTGRTFATFFSYVGHKLFHVINSIVRMWQRSQISRGVTKASALHGEFLMMILFIPSLITNADQQFIHVAIHENACFSERAAVAWLI